MKESLEKAARKQFKNVGYDNTDDPLHLYIQGAKIGAKWQKEQDAPLFKELLEALNEITNDYKFSCEANDVNINTDRLYNMCKSVIEKSQKLLQSKIKPNNNEK